MGKVQAITVSVSLRTVLRWLDEHRLQDEAECWVLAGDTMEPVVGVTPTDAGNIVLATARVWEEPAPVPLQYGPVCDTLLDTYSGGGHLEWDRHADHEYKGSHVVNPESAVFFVFLPESVQLIESHAEKMDQRERQAEQLTQEIERAEKPWAT